MMDRGRRIREFTKKEMAGEQFAGGDHLERAFEWCQKIGKERNADMEILLTAALLHDIGLTIDRTKHYEAGLPKARAFLEELGFKKEDEIRRILHVIEAHSRYGGPNPKSLEAKILQDVDAIEYVGAIGLIRGIVRALHNGSFSGKVEEVPQVIDDLIKKVEGNFYTEEAKRIVQKRIAFLRTFSDRLKKELAGEE
ncbi:MAG: HD domain-containing protein [Thermodesulfobacteriota bacterium]